MNKIIAAAFVSGLMAFAGSVQADMSGNWSGVAQFNSSDGQNLKQPCSIAITIAEGYAYFYVNIPEGIRGCGLGPSAPGMIRRFKIVGQNLFDETLQPAGTVSDTSFVISNLGAPLDPGYCRDDLQMEKAPDGSLSITEAVSCSTVSYAYQGTLAPETVQFVARSSSSDGVLGRWEGKTDIVDRGDGSSQTGDCKIDLVRNEKYLFVYTHQENQENCYFKPADKPLYEIRGNEFFSDSIFGIDGSYVSGVLGILTQQGLSLRHADLAGTDSWDLALNPDGSLSSQAATTCSNPSLCTEVDITGILQSDMSAR